MANEIPYVARLSIYPIKSLDRVDIETISVLKGGGLKRDREYALFDSSGRFVNGKRTDRIHAIRSEFDLENNRVALRIPAIDQPTLFHLDQERKALEAWLGEHLGLPIEVKQNVETGFPDDPAASGPTFISTATLEAIASWYPGLTVEDLRLRFRANIEISGVPAFWEDHLYTDSEEGVDFQVGEVQFIGVYPCQRCVVPTRDARTGDGYPNFQKTFVAKRRETLPDWATRSRFNHFYRLAINTRLPVTEAGKTIRIGDQLQI
ncbi:MAG: MOSC N-terminal beta barrel domain-containing protein [Leptolyngbyaceae cyanobacterium MO_188.B28]|nr:MOSC N-terminal beta barrel domain-containing protein [Leptolyngbyaceae cyanobacterium MO_188.B28]